MTQKIISFCLWGNDPKYTIGAIKNAELASSIYQGWECWFYTANCEPEITKELSKTSKVIDMGDKGDWTGMFWRFLPANDPSIIMISRDTDSRLSHREKAAVDEWLASDKDMHIMRDHPYHRTEMLGGMWGARNGVLQGIQEWMEDYPKGDFWQVDQNFLREIVYPKIKDKAYEHGMFGGSPFPTARKPREFVGQAFNADDTESDTAHGDMLI
jgi:protein O-GlcNAc transferase